MKRTQDIPGVHVRLPSPTRYEAMSTTNKYAESPSGRHTISIALCIVLVAISCYSLARTVERMPHLSPPPHSLSPDIQTYVDQAILRMCRDPVGRPDFALYADGGDLPTENDSRVSNVVLL